jgi:thiosulfate dehydrogenase [quinone] large subunit
MQKRREMAAVVTRKGEVLQDPPLIKKLLSDPRAGLIWLLPRIWLGWQWIDAASHKITNPAWMQTGDALKGFWANQLAGKAIGYDWYRGFLQGLFDAQAYTWFAKVVAIGELAVGVALILGAFTGIAAFFGGFMNWNFMMAGSASVSPLYFVIAVGLILAWKVSGYVGADFFLLRWIGTPWKGMPAKSGGQSLPELKPATAAVSVGATSGK